MSGHQHTFSQITQQTSKTHHSQVTAQTRDVQYHFRSELMAACVENINVRSNSNMDEPDIIDQSQLQSQRSSTNALQARDSHRSGGHRTKGQARDQKNSRTSATRSRESKMEFRASREGGKSSSRMQRIEIDQVNQSSIAMVDESTNRIEQQLNDELSLDESRQQVTG